MASVSIGTLILAMLPLIDLRDVIGHLKQKP